MLQYTLITVTEHENTKRLGEETATIFSNMEIRKDYFQNIQ